MQHLFTTHETREEAIHLNKPIHPWDTYHMSRMSKHMHDPLATRQNMSQQEESIHWTCICM